MSNLTTHTQPFAALEHAAPCTSSDEPLDTPKLFPQTYTFRVEQYLNGVRVDTFLARHLRNYTPFRLHRAVQNGLCKVDDVVAEGTTRVFVGNDVTIRLVEPPDKLHDPEPAELSIVFEDPWLIVVDKPAGILAHPVGDYLGGTLCNYLQDYLDSQTRQAGLLRAGIVHRLDRETSGLLVVCKEHLGHRILSIDFQNGNVAKSYLAIVEGEPECSGGLITAPIGQSPQGKGVLMSAADDAINGRPAVTQFRVLKRIPGYALIEARPRTGRIHQIRVHLASIGLPIVGDVYYLANDRFHPPRTRECRGESRRHALHATGLRFRHPITREVLQCRSELPADMQRLFQQLQTR